MSSQSSAQSTARQQAGATPTIDPRFILRPQTLAVTATLAAEAAHAVSLRGTLSPSLPGLNTLRLSPAASVSSLFAGVRQIDVSVSMPGMLMAPVRARLTSHGADYTGPVRLTMIGTYNAAMDFVVAGRHFSGTARLTVPI